MKTNTIKAIALASLGAAVAMSPMAANALEFQTMGAKLFSQFQSVADLVSGAAYLMGAGIGVAAALKFKEHNDNPQQTKLSKPLVLLMVAGALLSLPSFLTVGGDSAALDNKNSLGTTVLGGALQ